jgi:hypothetical protein
VETSFYIFLSPQVSVSSILMQPIQSPANVILSPNVSPVDLDNDFCFVRKNYLPQRMFESLSDGDFQSGGCGVLSSPPLIFSRPPFLAFPSLSLNSFANLSVLGTYRYERKNWEVTRLNSPIEMSVNIVEKPRLQA